MKINCGNCGKEGGVPTAVRPMLQHVQPSGRGMESEHEQAAKRSAVAFIEQRIDHNDKVRRRANRKRALRNLGSIAGGLLVLAAVAFYFTHRNGDGAGGLDELKTLVTTTIPDVLPGINPYTAITKEFSEGELSLWKNAPDAVKPKNAPAGAIYHALVPRTGYFTVYELTATGGGKFDVAEIAPSGSSAPTTLAAYNKACEGRPFFIAHEGRRYVGGSSDLKAMDKLLREMLAR